MSKPDVDLKRIEADLKEYAGSIPCKVHKGKGMKSSRFETDKRTVIYINPKKIRTQEQLDNVISGCKELFTV